jgi:hypothetical protein
MTIHRLMSVIASEQVHLRPDERSIDTIETIALRAAKEDRSDAAAE